MTEPAGVCRIITSGTARVPFWQRLRLLLSGRLWLVAEVLLDRDCELVSDAMSCAVIAPGRDAPDLRSLVAGQSTTDVTGGGAPN